MFSQRARSALVSLIVFELYRRLVFAAGPVLREHGSLSLSRPFRRPGATGARPPRPRRCLPSGGGSFISATTTILPCGHATPFFFRRVHNAPQIVSRAPELLGNKHDRERERALAALRGKLHGGRRCRGLLVSRCPLCAVTRTYCRGNNLAASADVTSLLWHAVRFFFFREKGFGFEAFAT